MTKMFAFDPADYAAQFAGQGWVHIPRGLTPQFHALLARQVEEHLQGRLLDQFALGQKQQALYQFPPGSDYCAELCQAVGQVCGLDADRLVLSERHIKAYDRDANPAPLAHKDRFASEVSVGFSVSVPAGSTLVLYPHDELGPNPFNSSAKLRESLAPDELPEQTLRHARREEIADGPGDVVMFRGNAIWHLRARAAGTTMLYLKLNSFHCDPLGEDPATDAILARSRRLAASDETTLRSLVPHLGRRVDCIQRRWNHQWQEVLTAVLFNERPIAIDEAELAALRAFDGRRTLGAVLAQVEAALGKRPSPARLRWLVERGVINLTEPVAAGRVLFPAEAVAGGTSVPHSNEVFHA